ncbi:enoyl-CoA hydratase/isomerase family protein [Candidatus Bathyarchaeota archaeon]|nr:enoyl-CoA hydratase/isomerase family protein [Candidatus Bathyarchaeota archaeon]MCK4669057.1 enoyl-CoA hydratase/isomerase family protein [Candidatus Bathyarchaeota archaeon]
MDEFKNIIYEKDDGVAKITINRPPFNILNVETLREISKALEDVGKDDGIKVLVITGAGEKAFSAGVEIKDHLPDKIEETLESFHRVFHLLAEINKPTVAVVRGFAYGGGCELASACDIVLASEDAQFGQQEVKVGAIPTVATVLLPTIIGRKKALEIIFTGDTLTAAEAKEIGLINEAFPASELEEAVNRLIAKFKKKSSVVLKLIRMSVYQGLNKDFKEALDGVTDIYLNRLIRTEDAVEGLKAFLEKRKPIWKGK